MLNLLAPEPAVPAALAEQPQPQPQPQPPPSPWLSSSPPLEPPLATAPKVALVPPSYCHPSASRQALLDGQLVAYAFKRSARRSIGFSIGAEGLTVSAPKWVTLAAIDQALQKKSGWILRKLQETGARHERREATRMEWKDGAVLPFRGEMLRLVLVPPLPASSPSSPSSPSPSSKQTSSPSSNQSVSKVQQSGPLGSISNNKPSARTRPKTSVALHRDAASGAASLRIYIAPELVTPDTMRHAVQAWLMQQARQVFAERLNHFAPQLGVQWRQLSLSNAATRWGSARVDGAIRLNWRLLHFKPEVLDYVVVHELSHLRVMDHSQRFWAIVQTIIPDYAALRRQLKEDAMARW